MQEKKPIKESYIGLFYITQLGIGSVMILLKITELSLWWLVITPILIINFIKFILVMNQVDKEREETMNQEV